MGATPTIEPAFAQPSVNVLFLTDANYMAYLAAALVSLIRHASAGRLYDVVVFATGVAEDEQAKVRALAGGRDNISIRFFDVSAKIKEMRQRLGGLFFRDTYGEATYYRLFAPSLLASYDKAVYCDDDIVCLADVGGLFDVDLHGHALGAVRSPITMRVLLKDPHGPLAKQVRLREARSYFNGGVMVMDLKKIRSIKGEEKFFQYLNEVKKPLALDEGALNVALEGDVEYIDASWNSFAWAKALGRGPEPGDLPDDVYAEYLAAAAAPKIIHYTSPSKPWNQPHIPLADKFWDCAKETPYYSRLKLDDLKNLHEDNEFLRGFLRPWLGPWLKGLYTFRVLMGKLTGRPTWLEAAKKARQQYWRLNMGRVPGLAVGWRGRFPWFTFGV